MASFVDSQGDGAVVRCARAEFSYGFEYQGAAVGLVRTPLTERCYLALTQAMKLGFGGSPTGPAGTGKTESVKALGSLLGRRVLVFNCDEGSSPQPPAPSLLFSERSLGRTCQSGPFVAGMDAGSMRRILSGLAQAGAWGCFDEFNRLEEGTMSAITMLVGPLQEAIKSGSDGVHLGTAAQRRPGQGETRVDPNCCLFITMNPAGDDYGGRRKLPDSLARLFRPIAMAHPDKSRIVESLLECAGFVDSRRLAKRLVQTFDTASKLLSKQAHYDWGLRALRSVLSAIPPGPTASAKSTEDSQVSRFAAVTAPVGLPTFFLTLFLPFSPGFSRAFRSRPCRSWFKRTRPNFFPSWTTCSAPGPRIRVAPSRRRRRRA